MDKEERGTTDGAESYMLPARTLAGSRADCLAELDAVITELLYLRRHLLEDEPDAPRHLLQPPAR